MFHKFKITTYATVLLIGVFVFPSIGNISTAEALGYYGCYDENRKTHITCLRQKLDSTPYGLTVPKGKRGLGKYGCGTKNRRKHVNCLRSLLDQHGPHLAKGAAGVVPPMGDPGMNPPTTPPMGDPGMNPPATPPMEDPGMNPPATPPMGDPGMNPPATPAMEDPNQFSDAEKQQWATNCRGWHRSDPKKKFPKDCTLPAWVPPGYTLSITDRRAGELIRCEPSLGCDPTHKSKKCGAPSVMYSSGDCITPGDGVIECRRKANSLTAFDPNEKRKMIAEANRKCG